MASAEDVYRTFFDCLKEHRWTELRAFLHVGYTKDEALYTESSFATELKSPGDLELEMLDAVIWDEENQTLACTILLKWQPTGQVMEFDPPQKPILYMEQHFNWFKGSKLFKTITMPDFGAMNLQLSNPDIVYTPDLIGATSEVAAAPAMALQALTTSEDLRDIYRGYIHCINSRQMSNNNLAKYVHQQVIFNGTALTLDQFRQKLESTIAAIQDLFAIIYTIVADQKTQRVAAQLESSGVLLEPLAGMDTVGSKVKFAEHCTYELRGGRIARIWSLANWGSLGKTKPVWSLGFIGQTGR